MTGQVDVLIVNDNHRAQVSHVVCLHNKNPTSPGGRWGTRRSRLADRAALAVIAYEAIYIRPVTLQLGTWSIQHVWLRSLAKRAPVTG